MNNKKLQVINNNNITCFNKCELLKKECSKKECQNWLEHNKSYNCAIILAKEGPKTLQEIGNLFNLSRMRICQIEKSINEKLKSYL
jgi:DNA-directed RNA polymerase sigma subunit (sigma70/sigma32)